MNFENKTVLKNTDGEGSHGNACYSNKRCYIYCQNKSDEIGSANQSDVGDKQCYIIENVTQPDVIGESITDVNGDVQVDGDGGCGNDGCGGDCAGHVCDGVGDDNGDGDDGGVKDDGHDGDGGGDDGICDGDGDSYTDGDDDDDDDPSCSYGDGHHNLDDGTTQNEAYSEGNLRDSGANVGEKTDDDNSPSEYFTCEDANCADDDNSVVVSHLGCTDDHDLPRDRNNEEINASTSKYNDKITNMCSSVQSIKRCNACSTRKYENIMNTLETFQTQSKWREHKYLTSCLQRSEENVDLKVVLFLEQGMAEIMQNNFSPGKKLFRRALQLSSVSENLVLLQGRAFMFLGNAYRKEGPSKYGKAFKCLTLAQQKLCLVDSKEDTAELNYFFGALYLNLLSISTHEPSQKSRDRIERHYQAVYDYAMAESVSRVREKIQRIFPLGMANFLLDGQTEIARSRVVPESKLKKAEDCLKYFARHFPFDDQPISMQTDYCKSRSDLEYRRGNLHISMVS